MQRLTNLISEILETTPDQLSEKKHFKDFEAWDSIKYMILVVRLEETFQIKFTSEEIEKLISLIDVRNILNQRGINE